MKIYNIKKIYILSLLISSWNAYGGNITTKEAPIPTNNFNSTTNVSNEFPGKPPTIAFEDIPKEFFASDETIRLMKLEDMIPMLYNLKFKEYVKTLPINGVKNYSEVLTELERQLIKQKTLFQDNSIEKTKRDQARIKQNIQQLEDAIKEAQKKIAEEEIKKYKETAAAAASSEKNQIEEHKE